MVGWLDERMDGSQKVGMAHEEREEVTRKRRKIKNKLTVCSSLSSQKGEGVKPEKDLRKNSKNNSINLNALYPQCSGGKCKTPFWKSILSFWKYMKRNSRRGVNRMTFLSNKIVLERSIKHRLTGKDGSSYHGRYLSSSEIIPYISRNLSGVLWLLRACCPSSSLVRQPEG